MARMDLGALTGLDPDGALMVGEHPVRVDASGAARLFEEIVDNIARVVQGNDEAIRLSVTCLVAGGHLLVEDVPGHLRRRSPLCSSRWRSGRSPSTEAPTNCPIRSW